MTVLPGVLLRPTQPRERSCHPKWCWRSSLLWRFCWQTIPCNRRFCQIQPLHWQHEQVILLRILYVYIMCLYSSQRMVMTTLLPVAFTAVLMVKQGGVAWVLRTTLAGAQYCNFNTLQGVHVSFSRVSEDDKFWQAHWWFRETPHLKRFPLNGNESSHQIAPPLTLPSLRR